jgi:hypothetical protein
MNCHGRVKMKKKYKNIFFLSTLTGALRAKPVFS